ncbi:putative acetylornithine deacetylase/succinyl-diaminopimelate desuccinylase [Microbacterium sp. TS-1]|uniref:DUF4304 domain-containing protein n=1 Tax=Microbacterium sp. TS-1 TaxID=1344956 RepID=UPI0003900498|nr:DUF4304 domain-containing protein [Microbacterium sp. TS-1]GAD35750.1 putative acetylornithine deacetylase/succinyl-diaminopimelate desuccinylase [Microbacterium sp. TS-1]
MTALEERLDALVANAVVPVLKPRGYRKKRLVWTRETPGVLHEVTLQRSQGNAAGHLRVYVEGAVYVAGFDEAIGRTAPSPLSRATPQYRRRFEDIVGWPAQWIDLETWSDDELVPRLHEAIGTLADHLERIDSAEGLALAKQESGAGLDLDLFAWWCAAGDDAARRAQLAQAHAGFGHEERWPRLLAGFVRVGERYGVAVAV